LGPSVAVYDTEAGFCYVIDASPDFKNQVDMLRDEIPRVTRAGRIPVSGILLTHAHFGHCAGLWQLGQEALDEAGMPVFCTARMREFLLDAPPFRHLVERGNISLHEIKPGEEFTLGGFPCRAVHVPHRGELTDTVGYVVKGAKSVIYIPDMDRWTDGVMEETARCDIALVDGTFYSGDELPRFSEVPHPPIRESVCKLKDLDTEIYFTHINHTNVLNVRGPERKEVERKGFTIAYDGLILAI
jgi:pyrroloquinoline quinone biosynthesis protein B